MEDLEPYVCLVGRALKDIRDAADPVVPFPPALLTSAISSTLDEVSFSSPLCAAALACQEDSRGLVRVPFRNDFFLVFGEVLCNRQDLQRCPAA